MSSSQPNTPNPYDPSGYFWLSFCDPDKPEGTQFVGACIIRGDNMIEAVQNAHRLGINPGGEVQGFEIPAVVSKSEWEGHVNKLMSREYMEENGMGPRSIAETRSGS